MKTALEFANVSAGYRGRPVLHSVDLRVVEGDMVGLLGPNGAGKTTFLRTVTGLCLPLTGSIRLFGEEAARLSASRRARLMAVVPQEIQTPAAFTVQELVMIGRTSLLKRWTPPSTRDWQAVERAMVYTDVVDMKRRPFNELSGGERQRTVVAMALAQEPRMILLDEATSHLDINHRLEIMQIVERLNREQGMTVLLISHDLHLAAEFCRRLLLLDHGRIAADGPPAEVLTEDNLRHVYHCEVRVQRDPATGSLSVLPARRLASGRSGRGVRVHVVAGGGCGEETLRLLTLCDYTVTCGVLNRGDSDAEVCEALGIETALEQPFSAISAAALAESSAMVERADAVVVTGIPFGPGNVANLDLAELALRSGKPVFMMAGTEGRDYTPHRAAAAKAAALAAAGAVLWRETPDLLNRLPAGPGSGPTAPAGSP